MQKTFLARVPHGCLTCHVTLDPASKLEPPYKKERLIAMYQRIRTSAWSIEPILLFSIWIDLLLHAILVSASKLFALRSAETPADCGVSNNQKKKTSATNQCIIPPASHILCFLAMLLNRHAQLAECLTDVSPAAVHAIPVSASTPLDFLLEKGQRMCSIKE